MANELIFVGTYAIPEGTYDAFDAANAQMGDFIRTHEPRIISWHTYVNAAHTEATSIHVHPDSASLEFHMRVAASRVRGGTEMLEIRRVELYGEPSEQLVEQLRQVSERSGGWPVTVKSRLRGFPD
jgi:hypothetical protein